MILYSGNTDAVFHVPFFRCFIFKWARLREKEQEQGSKSEIKCQVNGALKWINRNLWSIIKLCAPWHMDFYVHCNAICMWHWHYLSSRSFFYIRFGSCCNVRLARSNAACFFLGFLCWKFLIYFRSGRILFSFYLYIYACVYKYTLGDTAISMHFYLCGPHMPTAYTMARYMCSTMLKCAVADEN